MPSDGAWRQGRGAQEPESRRDPEPREAPAACRLPRFSGAPRSSVAAALREAGGTWHEVGSSSCCWSRSQFGPLGCLIWRGPVLRRVSRVASTWVESQNSHEDCCGQSKVPGVRLARAVPAGTLLCQVPSKLHFSRCGVCFELEPCVGGIHNALCPSCYSVLYTAATATAQQAGLAGRSVRLQRLPFMLAVRWEERGQDPEFSEAASLVVSREHRRRAGRALTRFLKALPSADPEKRPGCNTEGIRRPSLTSEI